MEVKFEDVIKRANTIENKDNTLLEYYAGGEHFETGDFSLINRGVIKNSTIGPMFYFGFKKGQGLIVSRNPHLRKAAIADFDGICSEKTFVVDTKDENVLLREYLPFIIQSDDFWHYAEQNKSGSVNYFVNWTTFAKYTFELPSLEKQKKLAKILWAGERTRQAYKKLLQKTDEVLRAKFCDMFGNPLLFNQNKDDSLPTFEQCIEELPKSEFQVNQYKENTTGEYPFYTSGSGIYRCDTALVEDENIYIATGGSANIQYFDGKASYSTDTWVIKSNNTHKVLTKFLFYALKFNTSILDKQFFKGSGLKHLQKNALKSVHLNIPGIEKQTKFCDFEKTLVQFKQQLQTSLDDLNYVMRSLVNQNFNKGE